jgi:hypothetical protein
MTTTKKSTAATSATSSTLIPRWGTRGQLRRALGDLRPRELDTLVPAHAATIHKSQSSEYPAVIIPVLTQHYAMLTAKSPLCRCDTRQEACGSRRPKEGHRDRGSQCFWPAPPVKARPVASVHSVARLPCERRAEAFCRTFCETRFMTNSGANRGERASGRRLCTEMSIYDAVRAIPGRHAVLGHLLPTAWRQRCGKPSRSAQFQ